MSFGKSGGSKPVLYNWAQTLTPWQQSSQKKLADTLLSTSQVKSTLAQPGLTAGEQNRLLGIGIGNIGSFGTGYMDRLRENFGKTGIGGGVMAEAQQGLRSQQFSQLGDLLTNIANLDFQLKDTRKKDMITQLLALAGTNAPTAVGQNKGGGWSFGLG